MNSIVADDREGWLADDIYRWDREIRSPGIGGAVRADESRTGPGEESAWSGKKDELVRNRDGCLDKNTG